MTKECEEKAVALMIDQKPSFHGEAKLWDKLKAYLPNNVIVYNNREVNGREFDSCVLIENEGILIIEVKGWLANSIEVHGVDEIQVDGYADYQHSPKKQARAYRFALLNKIKERHNISPLVFDMVCYPFISKAEYLATHLDIISEKKLTIFKEDLDDGDLFRQKIQLAYDSVKMIPHTDLTASVMLKLRRDWEPMIQSDDTPNIAQNVPYSMLSIFPKQAEKSVWSNLVTQYFFGTKEIIFVAEQSDYLQIIDAFSEEFQKHLFQLPSTIDLYKLVLALCNSTNPLYLANFIESNYTSLKLNYHQYHGMREADIVQDLTRILDEFFTLQMGMTWHQVVSESYSQPILYVLKHIYDSLQPWKNYTCSSNEQQHYLANYDYLIERIIQFSRVDTLTINLIADYLRINILTGQQQLARDYTPENNGVLMICTTVHKSKGLEYGTVMLPYTDEDISDIRKVKLEASYSRSKLAYSVQFDNKIRQSNSNYDEASEINEQIAEESRILYVALTRAIQNCVWINNIDCNPNISWGTLLEG